MQAFQTVIKRLSNSLNAVGALLLTLMMMLTVTDVILRYFGCPFTGTFELMSFAGALVVGLALAQTSLDDAHVKVDVVEDLSSQKIKNALRLFNKFLGMGIFMLLAWAMFEKARDLHITGEVSLTLHVPYYPVAYALSFCSLVEALVIFSTIFAIRGDRND